MPCDQYLYSDDIIVIMHYHKCTFADVLNSINIAPNKASSNPVFLIIDVRQSVSVMTLEEYSYLASCISRDVRYQKRLAVVLNMNNKFQFGTNRQFLSLCEGAGMEIELFNSLYECIKYIKKYK